MSISESVAEQVGKVIARHRADAARERTQEIVDRIRERAKGRYATKGTLLAEANRLEREYLTDGRES